MKLTLFAVSDLLSRNAKFAHNLMQELLLDKHFLKKLRNLICSFPSADMSAHIPGNNSLCVLRGNRSNLLIDFLHAV